MKRGDVASDGGAIRSEARLVLRDCVIEENEANRGGGLFVQVGAGASPQAVLTIEDSEIKNNLSSNSGGGIYTRIGGNSSASISRSVLSENIANAGGYQGFAGGGAIYSTIAENASLTIVESRITGNSASNGGGVRADMPSSAIHPQANGSVLSIERSLIEGNHAASRGGGLYTFTGSGGQIAVNDSVITGNDAGINLGGTPAQIADSGGGMYAYMFSYQNSASLTIAGSEISGNTAGRHGGGLVICTKRENATSAISRLGVYNTTISGNQAGHTTTSNNPGTGGGVHLGIYPYQQEEALDARFHNTTITANTADQGGGVWSMVPTLVDARNDVRLNNTIASGNMKHADSPTNPQPSNLHGSFNIAQTVFNLIGASGSGNGIFDHVTHAPAVLRTDTASGNKFTDTPLLGPLQMNGGLTQTHAPIWVSSGVGSSLAIDNGSNTLAVIPFTSTVLDIDQRADGFPRRFAVPATGMQGLHVDIGAHELSSSRVIDVLLDNPTNWLRDPYSFAEIIARGEQLRPIATQNVTTLQIAFSDHIRKKLAGGAATDVESTAAEGNQLLQLRQSVRNANGSVTNSTVAATAFVYDATTHIATWTFTSLADGKYAIHLNTPSAGQAGVVDIAGNALNLEWENRDGGTPDDFTNDPPQTFSEVGGKVAGTEGNAFRFHFALLAGDYNGDGIVTATEPVTGDGDGDGAVGDSDDINLRNAQAAAGKMLPLRQIGGADYKDDEIINGYDYAIWRSVFGNDLGDLDGDGDSDGEDFLLLQRLTGERTAWYVDDAGVVALGGPATLIGAAAPQVLNVIVSGSLSTHALFSFDTVDGSGNQLRTVPVGAADTVTIVFSEGVNVSADSLFIIGLQTSNLPQLAEFSYNRATFMATWRYEGWALGDQYLLSLYDGVTDVDGNRLDGEWTNPATTTTTNAAVSEFPSGDGAPGGSFNFVMTLMPGDANTDGVINSADLSILSTHYGNLVAQEFTDGDFDGDGDVDGDDYDALLVAYNTNLQTLLVYADFDGDRDVDDDDMLVIEQNAGMTGATWADGDFNGDGQVTMDDLDLAFAQWGLALNVVS